MLTTSAPTDSAIFQRLNELENKDFGKVFPVDVLSLFGHEEYLTRDHFLTELRAAFPSAIWIYPEPQREGFYLQIKQFLSSEPEEHWRGLEVPLDLQIQPGNTIAIPYRDLFKAYWMIDHSDLVVFAYDGRSHGSTYEAFRYTKKQGKPRLSLPIYKLGEKISEN